MNEKLKRLKELAEKATRGPWDTGCPSTTDIIVYGSNNERVARVSRFMDDIGLRNAEYIAAANPETIKALIAELEAKEAEVEALKKLLGRIVSNPRWCSIGAINNVAEIRISKEDYEQVLEGIKTGDA